MVSSNLHDDPLWPRAGHWITQGLGTADLALVGVGASKSAITPNNAHTTPNAIRDALLRYSTYSASTDTQLSVLKAHDFGDVSSPDDQSATALELRSHYEKAKVRILLGGDNSITYSGVSALGIHKKLGVITLDAHHDIREGISNGSPIRQLIESGLPGKNIVQIGINDFANSHQYARRIREYGIKVIHRDAFETKSIKKIALKALESLKGCTDIYLDIDIDVCDRSVVPAAPAAMPGGISAYQLRKLIFELARDKRINTFDITEIDASIDSEDKRTIRLAAMTVLEIAAAKAVKK